MKRIVSIILFCGLLLSQVQAYAFDDVSQDSRYYESVQYCQDENLMHGVSNSKFDLDSFVTRAMLVETLYRLENRPIQVGMNFLDVYDYSWYYDSVLWAKNTGVIKGIDSNTFNPKGLVTREQVAEILFRYSKQDVVDYNLDKFFDSNSISSWAIDGLSWMLSHGYISDNVDFLGPKDNVTRGELSMILMRYVQDIRKEDVGFDGDIDFNIEPEDLLGELIDLNQDKSTQRIKEDKMTVVFDYDKGYAKYNSDIELDTNEMLWLYVYTDEPDEETYYVLRPGEEISFAYSYGGNKLYKTMLYKRLPTGEGVVLDYHEKFVTEDMYQKSLLTSSTFCDYGKYSVFGLLGERLFDENKSDYENVREVYDWISQTFKYAQVRDVDDPSGRPMIESTLKTREGRCLDFSSMYASILRSQGIKCQIVVGWYGEDKICHAWCRVFVNGKWIVVDPTMELGNSDPSGSGFNIWGRGLDSYELDYVY